MNDLRFLRRPLHLPMGGHHRQRFHLINHLHGKSLVAQHLVQTRKSKHKNKNDQFIQKKKKT